MIGEAFLECLLPFIMSMLVDTIRNNSASFTGMDAFTTVYEYENLTLKFTINVTILGIIGVLLLMSLLSLFCGIMGGRTAARASVGLSVNLREDMFKKIESFSFSNIDKFSSSSLLTRLTTDIGNVQMAFQMVIRMVFRAPLMMIFSAIMAFISGGMLAWIFVVLIPLIAFGFFLIIKNAMRIFRKLFKKYDALNESVEENVEGIRVVKSFVREDYEKQKFNRTSDYLAGNFITAEKIVALNNPILNTAIHLANIAIMGIGCYFIFKTETVDGWGYTLSIGQMSSLLSYGIQILMSLMFVSMIMVMLVLSLESVNRIYEVLIEEPSIKNPENPIFEIKDGSIDFNHVNFKYKAEAEKNTLSDIDIHIKSGQFIGILGSTGSGKSTLVSLISRLYDLDDNGGEVLVGGVDVRKYDLVSLRDAVSVVLQKNVLFSGTISQNLRWGNKDATDEEVIWAAKIAQADSFVTSFENGYDKYIEQGGANVSGGQKQRLCIARALLKKPKILILDDSTSAVDTKTDRLIRKALKEDVPHITKIVIAQRISSIEDADQIIILNDGKIDAIGNHESLLKNNHIYQEIYYTQNRVGGDK
ncbi:MAG: ABC transporter ATP-binding protein [Bacilli bacterium]|nr:ABC transporter ATP-binding protein [Bacilli bacterium]